jgi:hypothetical protein
VCARLYHLTRNVSAVCEFASRGERTRLACWRARPRDRGLSFWF